MTKFKVGDKVRILHTDYTECGLDVGTVHSVTAINVGLAHLRAVYKSGEHDDLCFNDSELEHIDEAGMIEVGKTYTSKNAIEWLCIAVDGEYAHMRHADAPDSPAYCFRTDGTNISQGGGDWDVRFEPVIKTVTRHLDAIETSSYSGHGRFEFEYGSMQLTFETIDGVIDWSTARITDYN